MNSHRASLCRSPQRFLQPAAQALGLALNQKQRDKRRAGIVPAVRTVPGRTCMVVADVNSRRCQDTMTVLD